MAKEAFEPGDRVWWHGFVGSYGNTGTVRGVRVVAGQVLVTVLWDTVNRESEWPAEKLERTSYREADDGT